MLTVLVFEMKEGKNEQKVKKILKDIGNKKLVCLIQKNS
jgi:hypothetical protein